MFILQIKFTDNSEEPLNRLQFEGNSQPERCTRGAVGTHGELPAKALRERLRDG